MNITIKITTSFGTGTIDTRDLKLVRFLVMRNDKAQARLIRSGYEPPLPRPNVIAKDKP
jgi:hypothetical protein